MVPPLSHFQGINKNRSSLARRINTSRKSFFDNLTTLALIRAQLGFRIQVGAECGNKVIGPEEMPILVWGRRKRPPTKMGST